MSYGRVLSFVIGIAAPVTVFLSGGVICAENPASEAARAQELIEKEQRLRETLRAKRAVFVKKIVVRGARRLGADTIRKLAEPFENAWLTEEDIRLLLAAIEKEYGRDTRLRGLSYRIEKKQLIITVDESADTEKTGSLP